MSLKNVLIIAEQTLTALENLHEIGWIHSDQKPANIMVGREENNSTIYVIDFGLSKKWRHTNNGMHVDLHDNRTLSGTARYASLHNHLGYTKSRRDDLL